MTLATFALVGFQSIAIYVSPTGNDSAPGTDANPVRSITQAQTLVHNARGSSTDTPAQIFLKSGDYYLPSTLSVTSKDSNTEFISSGGATLHGEVKVGGWKNTPSDALYSRFTSNAKAHILVADLTTQLTAAQLTGLDDPNTVPLVRLLDKGAPQDLAQYPAPGSWEISANNSNSADLYWSTAEPKTWSSSDTPWAMGFFGWDWFFQTCPFQSVNAAGLHGVLTGKIPQGATSGSRFAFINVPEELVQPGEWYLDRKTNHLYLWPKGDVSNVTLSTNTGALINVSGTQSVAFTNLKMQGGLSDGVRVTSSDSFNMTNCDVNGFASQGIVINSCTNSNITHSHIHNLGFTGIYLNSGNGATVQKANNTVIDCTFDNYGALRRTYAPAVWMAGCGNTVTHNLIFNSPSNAILVSGPCETITYNSIHDVCTEVSDAASIYMAREPLSRGTRVEGNYFKDVTLRVKTNPRTAASVVGVYMDAMFTGATVVGNIFDNVTFGVLVGGGRDTTVKYNVFCKGTYAFFVDARGVSRPSCHAAADFGGSWHYMDDLKAGLTGSQVYQKAFPKISDALTYEPFFPVRCTVSQNVVGNAMPLKLDGLTMDQLEHINNVSIGTSSDVKLAMDSIPSGYKLTPLNLIGPRVWRY